MEDLIEFLQNNLQVLLGAPFVFALWLVLAFTAAWTLLKTRIEFLENKIEKLEHERTEKQEELDRERARADRNARWDPSLASVFGLIIICLCWLAKEKKVSINLKEVCDRLSYVKYDYAYGFLVALRAAKLMVFGSDFETYMRFDYIDPALTNNFKGDWKLRLAQLIKAEMEEHGEVDIAPFEAELRIINDYIEEQVTKRS